MRKCLFCPSRADSREHVWPEWLRKFTVGARRGTISAIRGPEDTERTWQGNPLKARYVCTSCNIGWMSDLEGAARPSLSRMIRGERVGLTQLQASVVAAWTMKTAMVFDALRLNNARYFTDSDCGYVRSHVLPPARVFVWTACIRTPLHLYAEARKLTTRLPDKGLVLDGSATTLGFGHLILQALAVRPRGESDRAAHSFNHNDFRNTRRNLVEIWPGRLPPLWPPAELLESENDLEDLAYRFGRPSDVAAQ